MSQVAERISHEEELVAVIEAFRRDPFGYVDYAFPWGRGELAHHPGPKKWQAELLEDIGRRMRENHKIGSWDAVQIAIASGHGIGKSALVAMLIMWAMSTHEDTRGVVTANTDTQLRTKTWPEVAKWHRLAINSHWFELTATRMSSKAKGHEDNWRIDIIPWSKDNTEAFAGLHNEGKRILVVFDESSAIHDKIWEVTEGALTDDNTEIIWFTPGNPTRQTGRFAACFGRLKHRWIHKHIDSRNVEGTNKSQIDKWVEDNGEDSDLVRVRVKGEFPLQAEYQLISQDHVIQARRREVVFDRNQPIVAGLDFARSGSCESVLSFRCGRDARSFPWKMWHERDSAVLAGKIAYEIEQMRQKNLVVHTIFADGGGLGGPIIDRLLHSGYPVTEVLFGSKATNSTDYQNKGSEMWARMRDWMPTGSIPDDPELEQQLVSRDYRWNDKTHQLSLVPKDTMLAEGLPSPDRGDSLSLTFAYEIAAGVDLAANTGSGKCLNDLEWDDGVDKYRNDSLLYVRK